LYWVEVDPSQAGIPMIHQPSLLVGTMIASGHATPDVPIAVGTQAQADDHYGIGSMLSRMFKTFYANNFANEVWGLGVAEPVGGVAATGTITVTTPPTEAGTIHLYIAGQHVGVNISSSDTTGDIATAIHDMIVDTPDLPVSATVAAGATVTGATGTGSGTNLTVSGTPSGTILIGSTVTGTGIPAGTTIVSQTSGTTGGTGVYVTSQVTTASSAALTFTSAGNIVTLTCKWKGVTGNDIRIDLNYYGTIGGEQTPIGLVMSLPATSFLTGGTGVPVFTNAISNLGEKNFEYVALPWTDSTTLNAWELEYGFEDVGRWGWRRQLYGHIFSAKRDTYSNLVNFGNTRNSGITSVLGVEMTAPSMVLDFTAAYVAKAQRALINDPARPLQTLSLNTVKLAPLKDRFDTIELNSLAGNGIATQKAGSDNQPMISRETTTYQLNLYGFTDDAYELVTTLATLARLIRNQRYVITSKYPRVKLADDGTRFGPGQAIVTPGIIKGELIAEYMEDMWVGLVENVQAFKANLIVERDPNDPNRVNVLYGPDLINQLRVFAVLAQFRLQYDRGLDTQIIGPNPGTIGMTGTLPPLGAR
jgi:phage tail sheath gpL-like